MSIKSIDPDFKNFVARIFPLDDDTLFAFQECFERNMVEKKNFILREGQQLQRLFFIKSGVFRGFHVRNAEEVTTHFFFGPMIYSDIVSLNDKVPSMINVVAMEGGEVWHTDIRAIEDLGLIYPSLLIFFIRYYEIIFAFSLKRQLSFIFDSAEQRYLNLFNERPKVISQMPLAYIASYLGIKPESLSRVRKKITLGKE